MEQRRAQHSMAWFEALAINPEPPAAANRILIKWTRPFGKASQGGMRLGSEPSFGGSRAQLLQQLPRFWRTDVLQPLDRPP
jgi:hypothetical protein